MGVNTRTEYECDRCGMTSDKSDFNTGSECGKADVSIAGNKGGKAYDGAWGGCSYEGEYLLCFQCGQDAFDFLNTPPAKPTP